jgi:hypothetical protein
MILRTWNVARGKQIREMVELVTADRPEIVCLQDVPVKALGQAGSWSGMKALGDNEEKSLFGGTGSLVLAPSDATVIEHKTITLNTNVFCEEQGHKLGLDEKQMRAWESPRRICQVVKVELPNRRRVLVANVHTSTREHRLVDAELRRAVNFVERQLELGDVLVFTGWYELGGEPSETISSLLGHQRESRWYGVQSPFPMLVVLGAEIESFRTWPDEERTYGGKLLSSYPPVEVVLKPS